LGSSFTRNWPAPSSLRSDSLPGTRARPPARPLRVLAGKERFSENHAWSEMPQHWPASLAGRVVIEAVSQGQLEARLADGGPPVDVVVPMWSRLPGRAIRGGSFGLIQQFGVGVDNIDLDAAADEGVWVANMPGLNAVPVAEHAVALLLALARRLPEAPKGFEPGRWGEPAGRSLAGTAACIVGAGAVGTQIALRLAAFGVTVTGVRRHPSDRPVPPFAAVYAADRLLGCVADVDSVIISAGYQAGRPPLVDDTVLRAMRPGAWLVNVARGALLDAAAAIAPEYRAPRRDWPRRVPVRALPGRRAIGRPPAHRGNRPHRLPHERLLRCRQPTARRCPRLLPRSSATPGTAQQ
jgi:phosphoglycerate dehydrogenase-like enzyme